MNEDRGHADSWHRHRRFRHTSRAVTDNITGPGRDPFTDADGAAHVNTREISALRTCTTGAPSGSISARSTITPGSRNINVVSFIHARSSS